MQPSGDEYVPTPASRQLPTCTLAVAKRCSPLLILLTTCMQTGVPVSAPSALNRWDCKHRPYSVHSTLAVNRPPCCSAHPLLPAPPESPGWQSRAPPGPPR